MTAPGMVSVIEKVLAAHQPFSSHWDHPREMVNTASCDCGNLSSGAEQPDALHAAHQARAVMAAISEAGAAEWGVVSYGRPSGPMAETEARKINFKLGKTLLSRITFPWERVE